MHYGWRRHSDVPRRRYWTALVAPLTAVAVILLGMVWEVTRSDSDSVAAGIVALSPSVSPSPPSAAPDDSTEAQLEANRKETESLRQQLADAQLQVQQGSAALIAANEKVQALEGEVAAAAQELAEARNDRDEARRVAGKMWEDWRQMKQQAKAVCAELSADRKATPGKQNQSDAAAACLDAAKED
jgi:hypothetical protein